MSVLEGEIFLGIIIFFAAIILVYRTPTLWLRHKLYAFWDGAGLTTSGTVYTEGKPGIVKHRPTVSRRKKTYYGYSFRLKVNPGRSLKDFESKSDALAQYLSVWEIKLKPLNKPGRVLVMVYKRDPVQGAFTLNDFKGRIG